MLVFTGELPPAPYYAVIVGHGLMSRDTPTVTDVVNRRVPRATQYVHVVVQPKAAENVLVRWSSPDGKNAFSMDDFGIEKPVPVFETSVESYVGVYPSGHSRGAATIIADISAPVNMRATFYVDDEIGVGFGCYGFIASGQSLKIVNGIPEPTTLAQADVAVVGPGIKEGTIPGYGCWGENFEAKAKSYRLVFHNGGRVFRENFPKTFVKELPYDAIDSIHALDVVSNDGSLSRLHLTPGAGTYFTGWIEQIDDQGNRLDQPAVPGFPGHVTSAREVPVVPKSR